MPLRMIGGIALGSQALSPDYPLATAAAAGVVVHVILAMLYGGVFAALAGGLRPGPAIVGLAVGYGALLWLINFYLIAPAVFPWFSQANPYVAFFGHAIFFGGVMGYILWRAHERLLRTTT